MEKICKVILALLTALSAVGCTGNSSAESSQETPAPVSETAPAETAADAEEAIEDEGWEKLESLGKVQTENGIFFVNITVPADLAGSEITQESLNANAGETYTSAVLNEDGSVTYKMTKRQHKAMMTSITESLDGALQDIVDDETNAVTEIRHNSGYTEFNVTLNTNEIGLTESFLALGFYIYGGMYALFSGETVENIVVNYYAPDGSLIGSGNSADLNQ